MWNSSNSTPGFLDKVAPKVHNGDARGLTPCPPEANSPVDHPEGASKPDFTTKHLKLLYAPILSSHGSTETIQWHLLLAVAQYAHIRVRHQSVQ